METNTLRYRRCSAFSLLEVVVAVSVFAGTIVAILGLLGPTLQTTRELLDATVAARLADGVALELKRVGYGFVVGRAEIEIFAVADGSYVVEASNANNKSDDIPRGIPLDERYFRMIVSDLDAPPSDPNEFRSLGVRVEWPYRLPPEGAETEERERKWFSFNIISRP
ncbi:MAG: type IV pilus modification PilV family protein [Opitutaceae bacterium]